MRLLLNLLTDDFLSFEEMGKQSGAFYFLNESFLLILTKLPTYLNTF